MERTWTFFGHWDNDRIVVEWVEEGDGIWDQRDDDGRWEQGLWAASGTGETEAEAEANVKAEYESAVR